MPSRGWASVVVLAILFTAVGFVPQLAPAVRASSSIVLDNVAENTGSNGSPGSVSVYHSANAMLIFEVAVDLNGCGSYVSSLTVSGYSANFWGRISDPICQNELEVWYLYRSSAATDYVQASIVYSGGGCCDWAIIAMSFTGVSSSGPFQHPPSLQTFSASSSSNPQIYVSDTLAGRRVIMFTAVPKDHCSCSYVSYGYGQTQIGYQLLSPDSFVWLQASYLDSDGPVTVTETGTTVWAGFADALVPAAPATVSITVTSSPATGSDYVTVDGSAQSTPYTASWTQGSTHTITANSPVSCGSGCQYVWSSWSDGGAQSHTIIVPSVSTTYTATFQQQYQLTMQVSPSGAGTTSPPIGQSWENASVSVQISATATGSSSFSSWSGFGSGSYSGTSNPASVTMSGPTTEIANLNPPTSTLVTSSPVTGSGYVSVDGSAITTPKNYTWTLGSMHTLAATSPVSCGSGCQYVWQSWSDNGAQSHTITASSSPTTYTANFQQQYSLTVSAGSGGTTNPAPGISWNPAGRSATVSAMPDSGYVFNGWTLDGGNVGNTNPTSVTMNQPHNLVANFAPPGTLCPYVNTDPPGLVPQPTQTPSCPISPGTQVTITAQPIPNWTFENFTVSGVVFTQNSNSVTFTMPSSPVAVIARYSSVVVPPAGGIAIPAYNTSAVLLVSLLLLLLLAILAQRVARIKLVRCSAESSLR